MIMNSVRIWEKNEIDKGHTPTKEDGGGGIKMELRRGSET